MNSKNGREFFPMARLVNSAVHFASKKLTLLISYEVDKCHDYHCLFSGLSQENSHNDHSSDSKDYLFRVQHLKALTS